MRSRIAVIFGGRSGEHEVSLRSAKAVIEGIDKTKYSVVPVAIDHAGHWLDPKSSAALLPSETAGLIAADIASVSVESIGLVGDPKYRGMIELKDQSPLGIDVAFPVLHGTFGEDGTIQGLMEMADVPYVGCGVLASSCGMDKVVMKSLFRDAGLPICRYDWFLRRDWEENQEGVLDRIEQSVGYPCFVKPANLGSSVGISKAEDREELRSGVAYAAEYDRRILVEEGLKMREIECAILGNDRPSGSQPGEYIIRDKDKAFLDYTEKYDGTGNNEFVVPAPVSAELAAKIRDLAVKAFKAVDGSGLARVDFFLRTDNGMLLVNEINTMPGLTDASGFPKMWAGSGKTFSQVIDELIELALERHSDRKRNKTTK